MRNPVLAELVGGERRALIARPRFVDENVYRHAAVMGKIDRRRRRAPIDCGEPASVAMRQDIGAVGNKRGSQPAHTAVCLFVFVQHAVRFGQQTTGQFGWTGIRVGHDTRAHPCQRPGEVDRRRAGPVQALHGLVEPR